MEEDKVSENSRICVDYDAYRRQVMAFEAAIGGFRFESKDVAGVYFSEIRTRKRRNHGTALRQA